MKRIALIFIIPFVFSCNSKTANKQRKDAEHTPSISQIIGEFDKDKDGKLSTSEVAGPLAQDFIKIDKNKDGFLSQMELESAPRPERRERRAASFSLDDIDGSVQSNKVNIDHFIVENIKGEISQKKVNLSGIETLCYVFTTHSQATEHPMGPWCPRNVADGAEKGGIWFKDGKLYDVSGHFVATLAEFYSDDKWKLYRGDGSIKVTETKEGCVAAAKPNVEEAYKNHCVECLPEYFKDQETTFVIPVTPRYLKKSQNFGRGAIGVAFNGVKYDPPAPTHAILAAHTLAPLDDHGGHVNPHGGYHYHAVTGSTKEIEQEDTHSGIIGYAIDGFGIYTLADKTGHAPGNLDECGGHSDEIRGYHYHAGEPGANQILKCLHGLSGYNETKE